MSIPDYQSLMLPLLKLISDGKEHSLREAIENLAEEFNLTEEERKALLPSGQQPILDNRVGWARTYMKKAGLLETTRRGFFRITSRGLEVLNQNPEKINSKYLEQFTEFKEFKEASKKKKNNNETISQKTPTELIGEGYNRLRQNLAQELIEQIFNSSPSFFEKLVIDLLVKMGYGGSFKDAGKAIGKSGDEGVDGIIKEDRLGLDVIYIQAKRWKNQVSTDEIKKFVGALVGKKANRGVFITTSTFSENAKEYVSQIETKVILIDREELTRFMIDYNVGVSTNETYEIKRLDYDYFIEN